jgi:transposase
MFRVTWRTVERIVQRTVETLLPKNRFDGVTWIGIDETSFKRGHHYLTVVYDLQRGRVIWVGEGKSGKTLTSFFDEFTESRARQLRVVSMDMSQAYTSVVRARAPQADIVYDKFHVVKLLLEAVEEVRRAEANDLTSVERKKLKGLRFAFLRNPKNLRPKDQVAIKQVVSINAKLARVYQLRVDFEALWDCLTENQAREFLARWTRAALLSRREPLRRFAKTVRSHMDGILSFFQHGVTNAALEGTNNKIKLTIHRAFGFQSLSGLMSMVYLCCGGVPPLGID